MKKEYDELRKAAQGVIDQPRSERALARLKYILGHKQCSKCLAVLPLEKFGKNHTYFDGYRSVCNVCRRQNRGKL